MSEIETLLQFRRRVLDEQEALLKKALRMADGNQVHAAELLEMDRGAFIRDFKKLAMIPPAEWWKQQQDVPQ